MYELQPNYDRAKSFYRKAFVNKREGGIDLYSYDSLVATAVFEDGRYKLVLYDGVYEDECHGYCRCYYESSTTRRHVSEFSQQFCLTGLSKSDMYRILAEQKKQEVI